jgi:hypothetical protein
MGTWGNWSSLYFMRGTKGQRIEHKRSTLPQQEREQGRNSWQHWQQLKSSTHQVASCLHASRYEGCPPYNRANDDQQGRALASLPQEGFETTCLTKACANFVQPSPWPTDPDRQKHCSLCWLQQCLHLYPSWREDTPTQKHAHTCTTSLVRPECKWVVSSKSLSSHQCHHLHRQRGLKHGGCRCLCPCCPEPWLATKGAQREGSS